MFQENNLYEDADQDSYIAKAGRPVFGTIEVNSAHCTDCASTKITKGNTNSGEKHHKIEDCMRKITEDGGRSPQM